MSPAAAAAAVPPWRIAHEAPRRLRVRLVAAQRAAACVPAIEALPGVQTVRWNPACRSLAVEHDGSAATRRAVLRALDPPPLAGEASVPEPPADDSGRVFVAAATTLACLALGPGPRALLGWIGIAGVLGRGLRAIAQRGVCVEALDALAVGIAAARGEYVAANLTHTLLELSGYLEARTVRRADDSLRRLLHVRPQTVWIERSGADGTTETVEIDYAELRGGEHVVVAAGAGIPVDGTVVAGGGLVNQAAVTGESLPQPRAPGMRVLAGTIVEEGRIVLRAERVGEATTTARISRYLLDALNRPAEVQTMASRLADRRVGITLGAAAAVGALTRDWRRVESVFLVDFACASKLGTPLALKAAMLRAAQEGCLIRGGQMLERLAAVDTIVFDKTGTLTRASLEVTDVLPLAADLDADALLALVASVAEHSTHPVADAVVQLARRRGLGHVHHEAVDFIVGHGLAAQVGGTRVRIGSRHYLEGDEGIAFTAAHAGIEALGAAGKSLLYVSRDREPAGLIALRDRLRPEAARVLARLRRLGVGTLVMITGDARARAEATAVGLGLDRVIPDCHPEDKAHVVEALRAEGRCVAFVGDGVNDGPALMAADVGIAMPRAADIARATAGIVLLEDRLDGLCRLRERALATLALIESNYRTAVAANSAILAAAAFGRLSPVTASALHNGTTIALLLRALAVAGRAARA